jgi:hypothetical protein
MSVGTPDSSGCVDGRMPSPLRPLDVGPDVVTGNGLGVPTPAVAAVAEGLVSFWNEPKRLNCSLEYRIRLIPDRAVIESSLLRFVLTVVASGVVVLVVTFDGLATPKAFTPPKKLIRGAIVNTKKTTTTTTMKLPSVSVFLF